MDIDFSSFINAIDKKDVELMKHLISTNNSENNCNDDDILLEIYNKQELTTD